MKRLRAYYKNDFGDKIDANVEESAYGDYVEYESYENLRLLAANLKQQIEAERRISDACRLDASRMGDEVQRLHRIRGDEIDKLKQALTKLRDFMWSEGYADQTPEMAEADALLKHEHTYECIDASEKCMITGEI